jgi:HK97 family phage major capsid protein
MKKPSIALMMIASALAATAQAQVTRGIVTVRADVDVKATVEALNQAFATFKTEHTKQLDDIKRGQADSLQALKVDTINAHIADLQAAVDSTTTKMAAMEMGVGGGRQIKDKEYSAAFSAHMKKGDVQAALNKGTAAEGGYLAPIEWDRTITDRLIRVSPMRSIATVQNISTAGFSKLFNNRGTTSGWVGETDPRPNTGTPTFSPLTFTPGEIYANPAATQQMLDDSEVDLEAWLAGEVETEFSYQEGIAFLTGNGVNKPRGILTYVTGGAAAAVHPWGAIATVPTLAAAAVTADSIIDLITALPNEYSADAKFVMNRNTQAAFRKLKDGQNNYLWQPSFQAGQPATLADYGIVDMPGMPDVAANAVPALFGDFKRGYLIVDRTGVRVLRDPYTNKPYVQFYTTKRVGGGVQNPDVIKALKVSAT